MNPRELLSPNEAMEFSAMACLLALLVGIVIVAWRARRFVSETKDTRAGMHYHMAERRNGERVRFKGWPQDCTICRPTQRK
jgi:hypothetical protein